MKEKPVPHLVNCGYFRPGKVRSKSPPKHRRAAKSATIATKKQPMNKEDPPPRPKTPTKNLESDTTPREEQEAEEEYEDEFDSDNEENDEYESKI